MTFSMPIRVASPAVPEAEIDSDRDPGGGERDGVATVSAHEDVSAAGTDQQIVAISAGEDVGCGGSGQHVVEGCAGEVLEAGEGVDAGA